MAPPTQEQHQNTSGRILRYFSLETNIEGINNAGRSRSLVRAAVWLGIFLIFLALTVSDITDLIRGISSPPLETSLTLIFDFSPPTVHCTAEFASNPVDVSTTLQHQNAIDFPSGRRHLTE